MPKIYITNKASHDYSAAKKYGKFVYLSEGFLNRFATNNMFRQCYSILQHSKPDDYILITSLNSLNVIACCIFVIIHNKLNLLIHSPKNNSYVKRNIDFTTIKKV